MSAGPGKWGAAAAARPVTAAQTRALVVEARRAYAAQSSLGLADGDFDTWRKAALWDACRTASFRKLDQADFDAALAYFRALAGGAGFDEAAAREAGDRRRAEWSFRRICEECDSEGLFAPAGAAAYCEAIARDTWKRPVAELRAAELRKLCMTLAARGAARRLAPAAVEKLKVEKLKS